MLKILLSERARIGAVLSLESSYERRKPMTEKKPTLKPLLWVLFWSGVVVCAACVYDNFQEYPRTCNPVYCSVEIHADRPLHEVVKEVLRENESQESRVEREVNEGCSNNEWSSMS